MTSFTARRFGANDTAYKSRITGRRYVVSRRDGFIRVHVNGRCIYGGESASRAFGMIELEDCAA